MIERDFDVSFVADLALREKQIQQNYRPVIAVHKWFARRPGTLFRGLLLSEFASEPLREAFYKTNDLSGIRVADPFMGGGTPLIEANRIGCDVVGYDINPMSYWIVRQEIEHLPLEAYRRAAAEIGRTVEAQIWHLYLTECAACHSQVPVKYFLWVKTQPCRSCGGEIDLFPGYLVAENRRHYANVFVCSQCGGLSEAEDRKHPGVCSRCGAGLSTVGPARRNRCECPNCGASNAYPDPSAPPKHRLFAIEYHCRRCRRQRTGRFFKAPDGEDLAKVAEAVTLWSQMSPRFVPDDRIPEGDETGRLHRWGYRYYRDMFSERQLLGLETICRQIALQDDRRLRSALATNLSDLLRYQNMLCRYDAMALKSLDVFSVHGFPVGLVQCESNILGIRDEAANVNVGSGGWSNIVEKFAKAKTYCEHPFEIRHEGLRKISVSVAGEWIGDRRNGSSRKLDLHSMDAVKAELAPGSLDGVFTDPPYYGNVQYAELMDFCYVWLRRLMGHDDSAFNKPSTRDAGELTANENMGRGLDHFTDGLSSVFRRMAAALKQGSPLVFTYHHNRMDAYLPVAVAILDSGLACSASLPCPAEMGASIHINGTGSSIIDTVFVCRSRGLMRRRWIADSAEGIAAIVRDDVNRLAAAGVKATRGDIRCIVYGHMTRLAVWALRHGWQADRPVLQKIKEVSHCLESLCSVSDVEECLGDTVTTAPPVQIWAVRETESGEETYSDDIPF